MVVLFGGCGSFLRGIFLLFGWYGSIILVMIFYLGGMVVLFGGYGTSIWGVRYGMVVSLYMAV